jgi:hypothetical protein
MKYHNNRVRKGVAIVLLVAFFVFPISQSAGRVQGQSIEEGISIPGRAADSQDRKRELSVYSLTATADRGGVLLQWHTDFELDNLGFDVYRVRNGERLRANRSIIPGSVFIVGQGVPLRSGYSYAWFDGGGSSDSVYYVESISADGARKVHEKSAAVAAGKVPHENLQTEASSSVVSDQSSGISESPASLAVSGTQTTQVDLQKQWVIAAQSGLKIQIKKDAWYRVTQQQITGAGFNPTVDIRNLSLYVDGLEIAIRTSKSSGQFKPGDYLEFYGQGLDTPSTDTRIYYLIAGTQPGKRVDSLLASSPVEAVDSNQNPNAIDLFRYTGSFGPLVNLTSSAPPSAARDEAEKKPVVFSLDSNTAERVVNPTTAAPVSPSAAAPILRPEVEAQPTAVVEPKPTAVVRPKPTAKIELNLSPPKSATSTERPASIRRSRVATRNRKRQSGKKRSTAKRHYAHAISETQTLTSAGSFDYTVQLKERLTYFIKLLNGDNENYFGQLIFSSTPLIETLPAHHLQTAAAGPAHLEVALQGIFFQPHQINVFVNNMMVGTINFSSLEHPVQTFDIPVSQLLEGNNAIKFISIDTCFVDYLKLTYPHKYTVENNSPAF